MTIEVGGSGGGEFIADSIVTGAIAGSSSGAILAVPATQGKRIKLSYFVAQSGVESDITITCGVRDVISSLGLEDGSAASGSFAANFVIGSNTGGSSNISSITTESGEGLTITKVVGSTSSTIYYTYQIEV